MFKARTHSSPTGLLANQRTPEEEAQLEEIRDQRRREGWLRRTAQMQLARKRARSKIEDRLTHEGSDKLLETTPPEAVKAPGSLFNEVGLLDFHEKGQGEAPAVGVSTCLSWRLSSPMFLSEQDAATVNSDFSSFMTDVVRLNFALARRFDFFDMRAAAPGASARVAVKRVLQAIDDAHEVVLAAMEEIKKILPEDVKVPKPVCVESQTEVAAKIKAQNLPKVKRVQDALVIRDRDRLKRLLVAIGRGSRDNDKKTYLLRRALGSSPSILTNDQKRALQELRKVVNELGLVSWDPHSETDAQKALEVCDMVAERLRVRAALENPFAERVTVHAAVSQWDRGVRAVAPVRVEQESFTEEQLAA